MARFFALLFLVQVVLAIVALISCLSADEGEIRALPRIAWVFVILIFPLIGSIAYFIAGRPVAAGARDDVWRPGAGFPEAHRPGRTPPTRPVAPDDDPEFLGSLHKRDDDELFRKWEEDLRRREDELRRDKDDPTEG